MRIPDNLDIYEMYEREQERRTRRTRRRERIEKLETEDLPFYGEDEDREQNKRTTVID